jgi:general stress protein 26
MHHTPTTAEQREHFHKLLSEFHTAMLVTHAANGRLRARPMAIARVEDDCRLWFFTTAESAKSHEIQADTHVHIVCQKDRSAYLSLSGRAALVRDPGVVGEIWKESFRVWFPDGIDDPNIELIVVNPEEGEFWDSEGFNKIKYLFASAKAYVTGTTPKVEEGEQHGRVSL